MIFDMQRARMLCDSDWKLEARYFDEETREMVQNLVDRANMLPAALDRISELEAALIEERAKCLHFCHVGDGEYCPDTLEEADHFKKRHLAEAKEELQAEGKI